MTGEMEKMEHFQKMKEEWKKLQKQEQMEDKKTGGEKGFKWNLEEVVNILTEEEKKEE